MDKDVADKHQHAVGRLEALDVLAKQTYCMASDYATVALLNSIRLLTNCAVLSASRYAAEATKPPPSEDTNVG